VASAGFRMPAYVREQMLYELVRTETLVSLAVWILASGQTRGWIDSGKAPILGSRASVPHGEANRSPSSRSACPRATEQASGIDATSAQTGSSNAAAHQSLPAGRSTRLRPRRRSSSTDSQIALSYSANNGNISSVVVTGSTPGSATARTAIAA
jgi:hypothetical protein